jgi:hypothetical protein
VTAKSMTIKASAPSAANEKVYPSSRASGNSLPRHEQVF